MTTLLRLRWVAIFATGLLVASMVMAWTVHDYPAATYWAVLAVFLLVADLVTRTK
jgi:hypothetical protein